MTPPAGDGLSGVLQITYYTPYAHYHPARFCTKPLGALLLLLFRIPSYLIASAYRRWLGRSMFRRRMQPFAFLLRQAISNHRLHVITEQQ